MSIFRRIYATGTLRQTLLWWVLGPLFLLLMLNVALIYKLGNESADRRTDRYLMDTSKVLLDELRTREGEVEFALHSGALHILTQDRNDKMYYSLRGWQQDFHFGSAGLPLPSRLISTKPVFYFAEYEGQRLRMMAAVMPKTDVKSGQVVVLVGKTLVLHDKRASEWMWRILPSMVFSLLFTGFIVWWGVGRGLRPLLQLRREVLSRSSQDLTPLSEDKVVAEIRPLIHEFNDLMKRLDGAFRQKRRFIADASHQLRTPLTGLKAQAELALTLEDPEEIRHSLEQICKAAGHAAHLVNQLLLLARSDPDIQDGMSEIDLASVVKNATESWIIAALQNNIDLGFEADSADCQVTGNDLLIREMLNNLIDNALRYTHKGGRVTVRIQRTGENVILEVEDNGPGIAPSDRERVFERFYRVLGTSQEGCGLGLAIVKGIAQRHHATIVLQSGEGDVGTRVTVTFRAAR